VAGTGKKSLIYFFTKYTHVTWAVSTNFMEKSRGRTEERLY